MTNNNILGNSVTKPIGSFSTWKRHFIRNLINTVDRASKGLIATDAINQNVNCGDCNACCTNLRVVKLSLQEQDKYVTSDKNPTLLATDKNGDCHYLVNGKCSIRDDRPYECRVFDCRMFAFSKLAGEDQNNDLGKAILAWDLSGQSRKDRIELTAMRIALVTLLPGSWDDIEHQMSIIFSAMVNADKHISMATTYVDNPEMVRVCNALIAATGRDTSSFMNFLGDD